MAREHTYKEIKIVSKGGWSWGLYLDGRKQSTELVTADMAVHVMNLLRSTKEEERTFEPGGGEIGDYNKTEEAKDV